MSTTTNEPPRRRQTDDLLSQLARAGSVATTTDEQQQEDSGEGPHRLIDVHVYYDLAPGDEDPEGEGTVPEGEQLTPADGRETTATPAFSSFSAPITPALAPAERPGRWRRAALLLVLGCALGGLLMGSVVSLAPGLLGPTASISVVPISRAVRATSHLVAGPGARVSGRTLPTLSMQETRTVPATGQGHQDAVAARGRLTFYNAALVVQVIPAGTTLPAAEGVQVVTEQEAVLPAGSLATNGQASVPAHAVPVGPVGNLPAGAIYGPCCRANVFAASGAFAGGHLARDYRLVQQSDLDRAAHTLSESLVTSATQAVQAQVRAEETLSTPLACTPHVTADQQAGAEATQVQVTVEQRCTGHTYQTKGVQEEAARALEQEARRQVGEHFQREGSITTSVTTATVRQGGQGQDTLDLEVTSSGTWAYAFTEAEVQRVKAQVAGVSEGQARARLMHTPGVQGVSISLSGGETLPANPEKITVLWLNYGG